MKTQLNNLFSFIAYFLIGLVIYSCRDYDSKSKLNASKETIYFLNNNRDSLLEVINQINSFPFAHEGTNSKRLTYKAIVDRYTKLLKTSSLNFFKLKISSLDIENFNEVNNRRFAFILEKVTEVDGGVGYLYYNKSLNHEDLNNTRISKLYLQDNWYFLIIHNF